jgi:heptosyltransferase-2
MKTLILKLGATGDVVRTSTLLHRLDGPVTWVTTQNNRTILPKPGDGHHALRVLSWDQRAEVQNEEFDLVINLEDELESARWIASIRAHRLFGAFVTPDGAMSYTGDASAWFDMSLISRHGRKQADLLKLLNRRTYQELIFEGLGWPFAGEEYCLPSTPESPLKGDVAIAPEAGPVWPMKKWAHYERLQRELESQGLTVHVLPKRPTLLEHLADVRGHRCLVSGDSLPMHLALGSGIPGVALFNCTSPWEIYDYGRLNKLVSPLLPELFYSRALDPRAATSIVFEDVLAATVRSLKSSEVRSRATP